jgi:hypothetical protein
LKRLLFELDSFKSPAGKTGININQITAKDTNAVAARKAAIDTTTEDTPATDTLVKAAIDSTTVAKQLDLSSSMSPAEIVWKQKYALKMKEKLALEKKLEVLRATNLEMEARVKGLVLDATSDVRALGARYNELLPLQ